MYQFMKTAEQRQLCIVVRIDPDFGCASKSNSYSMFLYCRDTRIDLNIFTKMVKYVRAKSGYCYYTEMGQTTSSHKDLQAACLSNTELHTVN